MNEVDMLFEAVERFVKKYPQIEIFGTGPSAKRPKVLLFAHTKTCPMNHKWYEDCD